MSSSPELLPTTRSSRPAPQRSPAKGKSKAIHIIPVIELTDSEDGEEVLPSIPLKKPSRIASQAGLSQSRNPLGLAPKPLGSSSSTGSLENIPSSSSTRKVKPATHLPLFLPSDEENEPPRRKSPSPPIHDAFDAQVPMDLLLPKDTEPEAEVAPEEDPASTMLAQVLEVVPDVLPEHAAELIVQHRTARPDEIVEAVIHALFESPSYPKAEKKGKRKSTGSADEEQRKKPRLEEKDYSNKDRPYQGGVNYTDLCFEYLMLDFPDIPKPHIRRVLMEENKSLYAPTHLQFAAEKERGPPFSYIPKKTASKPANKGKRRALEDREFELEREWLLKKLEADKVNQDANFAEQLNEREYEDTGDGIECGCCFSTYAFDKMIQCPETHLFCSECMSSYAEGLLGSHNIDIVCMDQSGCKLPFPVSELRRFLPEKLLNLYENVKQRKEIEMAGLEGLEECPFCDYKCVIDNPDEKLFRCGHEDKCGAITCRQCKKMDHLPKSCKEMEEDHLLDGRHAIEEAMTRALMRNCPRCDKSFVKEEGCNKMTCPNCRTLSCYVCRQVIQGYDHFNTAAPGAPGPSQTSNKCPLWEPVENRHAQEVNAAAERALKEYQLQNPDVDEKDIKVDLLTAPKPAVNAGMLRQHPLAPLPDANFARLQAQRVQIAQDMMRNYDAQRHAQHGLFLPLPAMPPMPPMPPMPAMPAMPPMPPMPLFDVPAVPPRPRAPRRKRR